MELEAQQRVVGVSRDAIPPEHGGAPLPREPPRFSAAPNTPAHLGMHATPHRYVRLSSQHLLYIVCVWDPERASLGIHAALHRHMRAPHNSCMLCGPGNAGIVWKELWGREGFCGGLPGMQACMHRLATARVCHLGNVPSRNAVGNSRQCAESV